MKKKKIFIIVGILVLAVACALGICFFTRESKSELSKYADKTSVKESNGYKLDLRIWGTYEKKRVNKMIIVSNFKDEDKVVTISNLISSNPLLVKDDKEEAERTYLIKGNKKYEVVNKELKDIKEVPYENTEIYLEGIDSMKNVKENGTEKISSNTYKVYKGTVSKSVINKIAKSTDMDMTFNKDCEVEVWLTTDNLVYKVYYRVEDMTIYASYFGIGKTGKVNLDEYKKETA